MTTDRWTIAPDGDALLYGEGGLERVDFDPELWSALVRCVRAANMLDDARRLAAKFKSTHTGEAMPYLKSLLNLLTEDRP